MSIKIKDFRNGGFDYKQPQAYDFSSILNYDFKLFPYHFSDKAKESFYLELSTLFSAGLDIKSCLELLVEERGEKNEKFLLGEILDQLIRGDSFSQSLQKTKQFSPYEYFSIQIGEESGQLSKVLDQLSLYYSSKLKQRRKILSALSYPVIIIITAVGAVAFMLSFVVPMFKDIFSRFGGELPALTKWIIGLSDYIYENFYFILVIMGVSIVGLMYFTRLPTFKRISTRLILRTPILGRLVASIHLATFCASMSLLLTAKVPLLKAISLIQSMVPFNPIKDSLTEIEIAILQGENLYICMSKFSIYDKKMLALVKVGEEVNKLDFFFEQLNQKYVQEVDYNTSMLGTIIEPLIIILLGIMVALILIAMYLPMFQMSNQVGL